MPSDFITKLARRQGTGWNNVKLANCAGCGVEITSHAHNSGRFGVERLFGRIKDRPYCRECYLSRAKSGEQK